MNIFISTADDKDILSAVAVFLHCTT